MCIGNSPFYQLSKGPPFAKEGWQSVPSDKKPEQRFPFANYHQFQKIYLSYSRFFLRPVMKNATNTEVANKKGSNPGKPLEPLDPEEVFSDELLPEFA